MYLIFSMFFQGIYVANVLADGPASSLLRAGDKILQVCIVAKLCFH